MNCSPLILLCACLCACCGCSTTFQHPCSVCNAKDGRRSVAAQPFPETKELTTKKQDPSAETTRLLREKSENGWTNETLLRDFALKETPELWQTVQAIRAQVAMRRKSVSRLEADLREFNVDPATDADCRRLNGEIDSLLDSLVVVFCNLEEAYIASKKFELAPSSADNMAIVKRALEEGANEANSAANRYCEMTAYRKEKHHE